MTPDLHCLEILDRYLRGKLTEPEARDLFRQHDDALIRERIVNGFTTSYT